MNIIKNILMVLLTFIVFGACLYGYLKITGKDQKILIALSSYLLSPDKPFKPSEMNEKPDYSDVDNWLSLPPRTDEADLVPMSLEESVNDGNASVDVFYIHGTGYVNNSSWTSPIHPNTATEDNAKFFWQMKQASSMDAAIFMRRTTERHQYLLTCLMTVLSETRSLTQFMKISLMLLNILLRITIKTVQL